MKREAHHHGMVRTFPVHPSTRNPKPETRHVPSRGSVPVAGSFSDVTSKASGHSKFTGERGRSQWVQCHVNPVSKSKGKTEGTHKDRTSNMAGFKYSGLSATGVLDYLDSFNEEDEINDQQANDHDDDDYENGDTHVLGDDDNLYMTNRQNSNDADHKSFL